MDVAHLTKKALPHLLHVQRRARAPASGEPRPSSARQHVILDAWYLQMTGFTMILPGSKVLVVGEHGILVSRQDLSPSGRLGMVSDALLLQIFPCTPTDKMYRKLVLEYKILSNKLCLSLQDIDSPEAATASLLQWVALSFTFSFEECDEGHSPPDHTTKPQRLR